MSTDHAAVRRAPDPRDSHGPGGRGVVGGAVASLLTVVLGARCPGCDGLDLAGSGPLCPGCSASFAAERWSPRPRWTRPDPAPPGCPPVVAAMPYAPVARALVTALKDRGVRPLAPVLAAPLAEALAVAVAACETEPVAVVVPSSAAARRRRGGDPVLDLATAAVREVRRAGGRVEGPDRRLLRRARPVLDQSGLDARGRWRNLHGALEVRSPRAVAGRECIVLDDVVTTGATSAEVSRALHAAGASRVMVASLCATQRMPAEH